MNRVDTEIVVGKWDIMNECRRVFSRPYVVIISQKELNLVCKITSRTFM